MYALCGFVPLKLKSVACGIIKDLLTDSVDETDSTVIALTGCVIGICLIL